MTPLHTSCQHIRVAPDGTVTIRSRDRHVYAPTGSQAQLGDPRRPTPGDLQRPLTRVEHRHAKRQQPRRARRDRAPTRLFAMGTEVLHTRPLRAHDAVEHLVAGGLHDDPSIRHHEREECRDMTGEDPCRSRPASTTQETRSSSTAGAKSERYRPSGPVCRRKTAHPGPYSATRNSCGSSSARSTGSTRVGDRSLLQPRPLPARLISGSGVAYDAWRQEGILGAWMIATARPGQAFSAPRELFPAYKNLIALEQSPDGPVAGGLDHNGRG